MLRPQVSSPSPPGSRTIENCGPSRTIQISGAVRTSRSGPSWLVLPPRARNQRAPPSRDQTRRFMAPEHRLSREALALLTTGHRAPWTRASARRPRVLERRQQISRATPDAPRSADLQSRAYVRRARDIGSLTRPRSKTSRRVLPRSPRAQIPCRCRSSARRQSANSDAWSGSAGSGQATRRRRIAHSSIFLPPAIG